MEFVVSNLVVSPRDMTEDGRFDVVTLLKREYKEWVRRIIRSNQYENHPSSVLNKDLIRVYHGTSSSYLSDILTYGLKPRSITKHSNWDLSHNGEDLSSIDTVVYVTTKWHFYYANIAVKRMKRNEYSPCYLAFDVPKSILIPDEDAFHSKLSHQRYWQYHLSDGETPFRLSGEESLLHYHTAGIPMEIPLSYLKEITILGDKNFLSDILRPTSSYQKDLVKWSEGFSEDDVKMSHIYKKQNKSPLNKSFKVSATTEEALSITKSQITDFLSKLRNQQDT